MANRSIPITLMLCAAVAAACSEKPAPTEGPAPVFSYGSPGCFPGMTPTQICQYFHGESAVVTGGCMYGDCFEVNYGELVRVVAADERGEYPRTWFAWGDVTLTGPGAPVCEFRKEGKTKTRVEIPASDIRCLGRATLGAYTYYEHFASRPVSQCLGWIECRTPAVPAP